MRSFTTLEDRSTSPGRRPRADVIDSSRFDEVSPDSPPPDGAESRAASELAPFNEASPGATLFGDDASDHSRDAGDPVSFAE